MHQTCTYKIILNTCSIINFEFIDEVNHQFQNSWDEDRWSWIGYYQLLTLITANAFYVNTLLDISLVPFRLQPSGCNVQYPQSFVFQGHIHVHAYI